MSWMFNESLMPNLYSLPGRGKYTHSLEVKVTFIAKPRKANCTKSSADHPISLPFFMLKTMEKMVDRHIRRRLCGWFPTSILICLPSREDQWNCTPLCNCIYWRSSGKQLSYTWAFLDIQGAVDSTSYNIVIEVAKWHGLEDTICHWISSMLGNRK